MLLRAQYRIMSKGDTADRSTCNKPVQGSSDESHRAGCICSWSCTQKCQGSVRCPHLSRPHGLLKHAGVFRDSLFPLCSQKQESQSLWSPVSTPKGWVAPQPCSVLLCSALHSSEMPHIMRNEHRNIGSRKHIPVFHLGNFPSDFIPKVKSL